MPKIKVTKVTKGGNMQGPTAPLRPRRDMLRKITIPILLLALTVTVGCTEYHRDGATAGGLFGGIAGAMIDHRNPWRGGVIGAALGAMAGATISDISVRGAQEAYTTGRPVEYRTEDGRGVYYAEPMEYNPHTRCRRVHEKVWEGDIVVSDNIREVCSGSYERPGRW